MPRVRGVEDGLTAGLDGSMMILVKRQGSDAFFVEAKTLEDALYFCVPMARTAAEAVQSMFKEPIFVFFSVGVANRGLDSCYLICRKNVLAHSIFKVALFKRTTTLNGHLTMRCRVSGQRMGAYFSDFVQTRYSWLPRTTMQDLARRGLSISSFLMDRTHIVGMAHGATLASWRVMFCIRRG
jgi:hypothetical protein